MDKIKVAVLGTGHLGTIHSRLWKQLPDAELTGIFDLDANKAEALAVELSCRKFDSPEEAINSSDAVTISVPTSAHYEVATKCIESGRHCLIEKPVTSTYEEARSLMEKAGSKGVIIQVGHVERFNPAIAALENYPLAPMFIEAHRLSQFKPRAIDVSVIHDLMIHDIDIMLWLVKSTVESVDANGVAVLTDTPDIANARIKFRNGAVANLTASRISANPMRKMRIFQQDAYISIDFAKQDVEVFRIAKDSAVPNGMEIPATMLGSLDAGINNKKIFYEKPSVPSLNAIAEEQKAFISAITGTGPVQVGVTEAAEALRIAEIISGQIG